MAELERVFQSLTEEGKKELEKEDVLQEIGYNDHGHGSLSKLLSSQKQIAFYASL